MTDNLKNMLEKVFKNNTSGLVRRIKMHGLNFNEGPSTEKEFKGLIEEMDLATCFIKEYKFEMFKNLYLTSFCKHMPETLPEKYWTEGMRIGATHDRSVNRNNLGSHFGCAAGDFIIDINNEYFYFDVKLSKDEVSFNKRGEKTHVTGSIGDNCISFFPNGDGHHFCLTFAKNTSNPDAKIFAVDMDMLQTAVRGNRVTGFKFGNNTCYPIQNIIRGCPEAAVELN